MTSVSSWTIDAIGHNPATNVMTVRFKNGGTYEYSGVSASLHSEVMGAKSVGATFAEKIKKGGFAHRKL